MPQLWCALGPVWEQLRGVFLWEGPRNTVVVYHLPQIPRNFGWDVNGKRFFGSSHWEIPGTNGDSEKVVPFSRLTIRMEIPAFTIYKFLDFRTSFIL